MEDKSECLTKSCTDYSKPSSAEISVSGTKFEIPVKNILKYPGTLLEKMLPELTEKTEISFNRPDDAFKSIQNFYLTSKLHMARNMCPEEFAEEMEYWGIKTEMLEPCCLYRYLAFKQQEEMTRQFRKTIHPTSEPETTKCSSWRQRLWLIVDNRDSSPLAKV
ncbi:potassium voltage-gated channel subfamily B member 2-like [Saccostrea cucullata]|uniref:potassium voltage-gated channel subfamily B member 2-like n=1 Tax=Saccostrea cuccullata TaxID=36930 RepID=UPI002ED54D01